MYASWSAIACHPVPRRHVSLIALIVSVCHHMQADFLRSVFEQYGVVSFVKYLREKGECRPAGAGRDDPIWGACAWLICILLSYMASCWVVIVMACCCVGAACDREACRLPSQHPSQGLIRRGWRQSHDDVN